MKIGLFDFQLDKSKIALAPANPRDHSKLMILDSSRKITHKHFYDLPDLLSPKDVIVINDTNPQIEVMVIDNATFPLTSLVA